MSLTKVAANVRTGVVVFAVLAFLYYMGILVVIPLTGKLITSLLPDRNPPAPIYGNLPPLEFYAKEIKGGTLEIVYNLDTATGRIPTIDIDRLPVYKFKPVIPSFEKGKIASYIADLLGFTENDFITQYSDELYKWKYANLNSSLEIETGKKTVDKNTPLTGRTALFKSGNLTSDTALKSAIELFDKAGFLDDPLYKAGERTVKLGRISNSRIYETSARSDVQVARVDFFRSINDFKILGPDPSRSLLYTFVSSGSSVHPVIKYPITQAYVWEIEQQTNATYPIISPAEAWNAVSKNKGVIVGVIPTNESTLNSYNPVKIEEIYINNINFAYYDTPKIQKYLQPIYVFEGKYTTKGTEGGLITIYYPAVSPEYIGT